MKKFFTLAVCILLVINLLGCKIIIELPSGSKQPEISATEASAPDMQSEPVPTQTEPVPTQTEPMPTEETVPETLSPERIDVILADVMYEKQRIRTENGSIMYVNEYVAMHGGTKATDWRYLDFDQDGVNEVFVVTDSMDASYMVIHWNGTAPVCFCFGFRAIQELKENGYMSGSNSASSTTYYWISFTENDVVTHTLADFDTYEKRFVIQGKTVTEEEANNFLREWYEIPNVIGTSYYPTEDTQKGGCVVCGRWYDANFNWETGLCEECSWVYGRCVRCGRISADIYEGICDVCEPYGGMGEPSGVPGFCLICNQSHDSTIGGACDNCRLPGGRCCNLCGRWTNEPASGYCPSCKAMADWAEQN